MCSNESVACATNGFDLLVLPDCGGFFLETVGERKSIVFVVLLSFALRFLTFSVGAVEVALEVVPVAKTPELTRTLWNSLRKYDRWSGHWKAFPLHFAVIR